MDDPTFVDALVIQVRIREHLRCLLDEDEEHRSIALGSVIDDMTQLLGDPDQFCQMVDLPPSPESAVLFRRAALKTVARHASETPFHDVRESLTRLVSNAVTVLGESTVQVPRGFLSNTRFSYTSEPSLANRDAELLRGIVLQDGCVTLEQRLLSWHSEYLTKAHGLEELLFSRDAPLPATWGHYLCVMAAAVHRCTYLAEAHMKLFIGIGGEAVWIKDGLLSVPPKLRRIAKLNDLLAHQPWLVNKQHVEEVLKGDDAWSMAELIHALVLLAATHARCSFVLGLGVGEEMDGLMHKDTQGGVLESRKPKGPSRNSEILARLDRDSETEEASFEEVKQLFDSADRPQTDSDREGPHPDSSLPAVEVAPHPLDRFREGITHYVNYDVKSNDYHALRAIEFSWSGNAFDIMSHVMPEAARAVDDLFQFILTMTDSKMNGVQAKTTEPLRHAVWYYTHRVYGVLHDDYPYQQLNKLLTRATKNFVKCVTCLPETVNSAMFASVDVDLQAYEYVHVVLLGVEARKQSELLYGLRALMNFKAEKGDHLRQK
eukprot:c45680_g1_i1.p1 GENE.c45680_g1_i1~~c45680_g1_i1.p1  ORF type:complete len:563 (+),score=114.81 c45680_g1_i1:52-1689(+)